MKDRVPRFPGRVKLTPVSGQENTFDMVRADQPTQEGTPLSKANLLSDATASALGLTGDPTVDDALAKVGDLAATSEYKIGDIMVTTRQDPGDEWVLCNGAPASAEEYPALSNYFDERINSAIMGTWSGTAPPTAYKSYDYGPLKYINGWYLWPYSTGSVVRILYTKNLGNTWETTGDLWSYTGRPDIYYVGGYYVLTGVGVNPTYIVYNTDFKTHFSGTVPAPYGTITTVPSGFVQVDDALYGLSATVSGSTPSLQLWRMQADNISNGFSVVQTIEMPANTATFGVYASASGWYFNSALNQYFFLCGYGPNYHAVSIYALDPTSASIEAKSEVFATTSSGGGRFWDAGDAVVASDGGSNFKWFSKSATTWDSWSTFTPPTTNISLIAKIKNKYVFANAPTGSINAFVADSFGGASTSYSVSTTYLPRVLTSNGIILALDLAMSSGQWQSYTKFYVLRDPDIGFEAASPLTSVTSYYQDYPSMGLVGGATYLRASTSNAGSYSYPIINYIQSTLPAITFDGAYAYIKAKEATT